jgi:hypothetical protein
MNTIELIEKNCKKLEEVKKEWGNYSDKSFDKEGEAEYSYGNTQ